jgi:hypothetical protein
VQSVSCSSVKASLVVVGQGPWLTANYRGRVGRVAVAVFIERSKHGADRRLGMFNFLGFHPAV